MVVLLVAAGVAGYRAFRLLVAANIFGENTGLAGVSREPTEGTEELWSIKEVCDQIVFLLQPEKITGAAVAGRIEAAREPARANAPVIYAVSAGPAKETVAVTAPVWDPVIYQGWCKTIAGSSSPAGTAGERPSILTELLTPTVAKFLALDERLSGELAKYPHSAAVHTDAALVLGTLAWLDRSGDFQDVRPLLHRMTACLAVADFLGAKGVERDTAELLRLVLLNDQVAALKKLAALRSSPGIPVAWLDALELGATHDWTKTKGDAATGPLLLQWVHVHALASQMGSNEAESFIKQVTKPEGPEWLRCLTQTEMKIGQGHQYTRGLLQAEAEEANVLAKACGLVGPLNSANSGNGLIRKFDGRVGIEREPESRLIGTPYWSSRAQRNFFQALATTHHFIHDSWGVPEEAEKMAEAVHREFSEAYYYPFLSLLIERADQSRRGMAQTAGEKIAREHPQTVAPKLWFLLKAETPEGIARKTPDFHFFFNPELPRHTSFEAGKRITEIGIGDENNLAQMQGILARCPNDYEMAMQTALLQERNGDGGQAKVESYQRFGEIQAGAARWLAYLSRGNPQRFEQLNAKRAESDPDVLLELAVYFQEKSDLIKAEKYLLQARGKVDSVYFANVCGFLVRHYARTGRLAEAESLAREAADTYSASGLGSYGWLKEFRKEWDEAERVFRAIDERYGSKSAEFPGYIIRRKLANEGWKPEFENDLKRLFPSGIEKVTLESFGDRPPKLGTRFAGSNETLTRAGLSRKDVIVAIDDLKVESMAQYLALRGVSESSDMRFIIWDGQGYAEVKVNLPGRRFGLDMADYRK